MLAAILTCALIPAVLFLWNLLLYTEPPPVDGVTLPSVSVLIPARNEEASIRAAVQSVLASRDIQFELIVLDDGSADRTAEIAAAIAEHDPRVRLEHAPPLPAGWNGKQHACHVLASLAKFETLCFLDADVRVAPAALARMTGFLSQSLSDLVSGFPLQETKTCLEWMLLPLIHFVLLGFLPIAGMRAFPFAPSLAAGCGQFILLRRSAYRACGGHREIRKTMHDGLLLPKLFRSHGYRTDIADLTNLASCRMYRSAAEVWRGLMKNATEGLAAPARILPFTILLFGGQVLPILLLPFATSAHARMVLIAASIAAYLPRLISMVRFRQNIFGALLHPAGVFLLLCLQWCALARKLAGVQATWKQRVYDVG
jgi:glycosyltransferase involved in cell wall biosynthesis